MKRIVIAAALSLLACEKRADTSARDSVTPVASVPAQVAPAAAPSSPVTDSATVNGTNISLRSAENGCVAAFADAVSGNAVREPLALSPKAPCYFVRRNNSAPQVMQYADVSVNALLIVVGTAAGEDVRKNYSVSPGAFCGTTTQALVFRTDSITLSKTVRQKTFVCKDAGVDEKEFWAFAHDK